MYYMLFDSFPFALGIAIFKNCLKAMTGVMKYALSYVCMICAVIIFVCVKYCTVFYDVTGSITVLLLRMIFPNNFSEIFLKQLSPKLLKLVYVP